MSQLIGLDISLISRAEDCYLLRKCHGGRDSHRLVEHHIYLTRIDLLVCAFNAADFWLYCCVNRVRRLLQISNVLQVFEDLLVAFQTLTSD